MKLGQKSSSNSNFNLKGSKKRDNSIDEFDIYGRDLKAIVESSCGKQVPDLVAIFEHVIRQHGLLVQGLFRVSGNKTRMDEIRALYCQSGLVTVSPEDIHNITGLYKTFLREIPGGLIPYGQAIDLIKATKIHKKNENLDLITSELLKLPVPHYNLLKFTCSLLSHVCKCSGSNLMNSENLGTVFGPTFFSAIEDISLLSTANTTTAIFIQNYNELFKISAPVHTNLNQNTENNNKNGGVSTFPHINGSKNSNDQNIKVKFGESYLSINLSNDNENSFQEEESMPFSDKVESSNLSNSFIGTPQISNSLALALKMCVNNHLFDQVDGNEFTNGDFYHSTNLISDFMLNGRHQTFQQNLDQNDNLGFYNSNNQNTVPIVDRKKYADMPKSSLQRHLPQFTNSQNNMIINDNMQRDVELNKMDSFSLNSKSRSNTEPNHNRPTNQVPQLDFSSFIDPITTTIVEPDFKNHNGSDNKQVPMNRFQKSNNTHHVIHENKVFESDSYINQLKKKISALKSQIQIYEDSYLANNGVRPDKAVKLSNEWYQKTLLDLRMLRQEKEVYLNSNKMKDVESDSVKIIKKKTLSGSGDNSDYKFSNVPPIDNVSINSRPVSVLSESGMRPGVNNESARSNTLNSIGITSSVIEDLSPREWDSLKITLDQISTHLREERIRDNRPENLDLMTPEQIECEKVTMQKALLNFECKYGRRKNPNAIQLMRPLYDRYRQVKKRLNQINESSGQDSKHLVQRTLDNRVKSNMYQSAWTSDKPLSSGITPSNYFNAGPTNNLSIIMPSNVQFENSDMGEDSVSLGQMKPDVNSRAPNQSKVSQSQKRNSNTFQYRKSNIPNDFNNNNNILNNSRMTYEDLRLEHQRLLKDKRELQRILKDFENTFERETRRKLEKSDRLPMEREYARYKMIKSRIKELEESFENSVS